MRVNSGYLAAFAPIKKNVARAPYFFNTARTCGVVSGSGPSSIVNQAVLASVQYFVATGPNPCSDGITVTATSSTWETNKIHRPQIYPAAKIGIVRNGANKINQIVAVGRNRTALLNQKRSELASPERRERLRQAPSSKRATFEFTRNKSGLPNYYYFYLNDADWGESVIKVCSYAPWGLKLYLNGHEWLKRQLTKESINFESLDNGFLSCQNPERLHEPVLCATAAFGASPGVANSPLRLFAPKISRALWLVRFSR
jgi:hypothetical protein